MYFLNANDLLFDEGVLDDVINTFKTNKEDILFGDVYMYCSDPNNNYVNIFQPETIYKQDFFDSKYKLWDGCINHQTIFYRKRVFDKCGLYSEKFPMSGDYEFNVRAIVKYKFKPIYINRTIAKFDLGGFSTYNSIDNYMLSTKGKETIREMYLLTDLDFIINRVFSNKIRQFISKYFRTFLRKYDNNPDFRHSINKCIHMLGSWKVCD